MRICIIIVLWLGLARPLWADGYFAFENRQFFFGINAPVFDAQGNRLAGGDYLAALYVGSATDSLRSVVRDGGGRLLAIQPFETGRLAGYIKPELVAAPNIDGGSLAWVQMRAWDARFGATYEAAQGAGLGGYGESTLFQVRAGLVTGAGTDYAPLVGLESFSLRPVIPEPGTIALLLISLPVLWLALRRRSS